MWAAVLAIKVFPRRGRVRRSQGSILLRNLLAQAMERAQQEHLQISLGEGDAEALPFKDGEFDVVMSMFGAMFAPRPEIMASEFVRVCRPGGLIAMGNWTLDSFISKQTAIMNRFVPAPPGATNPMDWGEEAIVRQRFGDRAEVVCTRRTFVFDLPFAPEESAEFFGRYLGPAQVVVRPDWTPTGKNSFPKR